MANSKISALTAATTPVAGTEVLPIVQSSATKQLSIADLTPGLSTITAAKGGTGQTSYAVGDLLYADTTTTLAKLADVATGNAIISGGVGVAPSYGKIGLTTHVNGILPVANGGTATSTAFTTGSVVFAAASGVYSQNNADFFWDDTNFRLGLNTATPQRRLHIVGNGGPVATFPSIGGADNLVLENNGNDNLAFVVGTTGTSVIRWYSDGISTEFATIKASYNAAAPFLSFSINNVEYGRFNSTSGYFGLGTTTPGYILNTYASSGSLSIQSVAQNNNGGSGVAAIGFSVSSVAGEGLNTKGGIGFQRNAGFGGGFMAFYNNNSGAAGDFTTADEAMRIDNTKNVLVTAASGLGYGTGAGGTVTQATSRTTGVTLSKPTGAITMFSALGSVVAATFTVTNTLVAATDTIILNQKSGTNLYVLLVTAVAAGSFNITFYTTGGIATDAPVINFAIIKGVTA
jgi:hypothetical protein